MACAFFAFLKPPSNNLDVLWGFFFVVVLVVVVLICVTVFYRRRFGVFFFLPDLAAEAV